jgi:hypothetical protein
MLHSRCKQADHESLLLAYRSPGGYSAAMFLLVRVSLAMHIFLNMQQIQKRKAAHNANIQA